MGVAKAIPVIANLIDQLTEAWVMKAISEIKGMQVEAKEKRRVLFKAIKGAKTDEERKVLSIILSDLISK